MGPVEQMLVGRLKVVCPPGSIGCQHVIVQCTQALTDADYDLGKVNSIARLAHKRLKLAPLKVGRKVLVKFLQYWLSETCRMAMKTVSNGGNVVC